MNSPQAPGSRPGGSGAAHEPDLQHAAVDLRAVFSQAARHRSCGMAIPDLPVVIGDARLLRRAAEELMATISAHSGGLQPPEVVSLRGTAEHIVLVRWRRDPRNARFPGRPGCVDTPAFPVTRAVMERHGGRLHVVAMDEDNYRALLFMPPAPLLGSSGR